MMRRICFFIATIAVISLLPFGESLKSQCLPVQTFELIQEGEIGDERNTVGISGNIAVLVDDAHDPMEGGGREGCVYLFDTSTGQSIGTIVGPGNGGISGWPVFGDAVAISGNLGIVAEPSSSTADDLPASVYLYDVTLQQQLARFFPDDPLESSFGRGVDIDGNTVIVGDAFDSDNGQSAGAAYLFDTTTNERLFKLLPNDGAAGDVFGAYSVGIFGTTAIVGSRLDDDNGDNSGSAYLFDTITGQQIAKLLPDDGAAVDTFGCAVAISGEKAIIGSRRDDDNGEDSGSAYLFDVATGEPIFKLFPEDGDAGDLFGFSVAIDGNLAIIGATGDDDNGEDSGSAYLFDVNTGQQLAKLLPDNGGEAEQFGRSVDIDGDMAIVARTSSIAGDGSLVGSAYLFDVSSCNILFGDVNQDGIVSLIDVQPFVALLTSGEFQVEADINQDGVVNLEDVQPFVDLLAGS